jgi:hypothetical protein
MNSKNTPNISMTERQRASSSPGLSDSGKKDKKGARNFGTKHSARSIQSTQSKEKFKLMKCIVHTEQTMTHYSTSMREFVCPTCMNDVVQDLTPSGSSADLKMYL